MKSTRNKFEVTPMMVMQVRQAANPIFSKRISDVWSVWLWILDCIGIRCSPPELFLDSISFFPHWYQSQCWWFYRYATSPNIKYYINRLIFIFDALKDRLYNLKMFCRLEVWVHYKSEATESNEAQKPYSTWQDWYCQSWTGHLGLWAGEYLIFENEENRDYPVAVHKQQFIN